MTEVETMQELKQELMNLKKRLENEQRQLVETNEKQIESITVDLQKKLETEQGYRNKSEDDLSFAEKCSAEEKRQLSEDIDTEIDDMRRKYAKMLDSERVATLRFKGENGIMRKKFTALTKDIESQREEIKSMLEKEKKLHHRITALKTEIQGYEDLIREKDTSVALKEKAIYGLKKKNQELEKFKFVLDYKIKELKRQIEPRENELKEMKKHVGFMDGELERYHKSNANLDREIGTLRRDLDRKQVEILANREHVRKMESFQNRFKCTLHDAVQLIQQPTKLRAAALGLYENFSGNKGDRDDVSFKMDDATRKEFERQKAFMKTTVASLKRRVASQLDSNERENRKLISENMGLIKEITELRKMERAVRLQSGTASAIEKSRKKGSERIDAETIATIENQRKHIAELKAAIGATEERIRLSRPHSRGERLPPIDLAKERPGAVGVGSLPPVP